jgi:AcrR family transcriptional regulator
MASISRREHLINTAIELFSEHGFHGTGIDTLLAKTGMSKRTLYTYFRSKDELILAVLRHKDGLLRNQFMANVGRAAEAPEARLLAVYDVAEAWFKQKNFFGCMFINAVGEYADADSPIRHVSIEYKKLMRNYLLGLCNQLDVERPEELADALALLLEGAIVTAQVSRNVQAAQTAKKVAKILIDNARQKTMMQQNADRADART